jgi:hypothetical protein
MAKKVTLKEKDLTQKIVKECFDYHEDGYLIWKDRPDYHFAKPSSKKIYTTQKVGKRAGRWHKRTDRTKEGFGYWVTSLTIDGELGAFKLHRLIFMRHHGYFPEVVDHVDNDTDNNKIENLRESSSKTNIYNMYKPKHNTSGYKGVTTLSKINKFRAEITCKNVWFHMGHYEDPRDAACVYDYVAQLLFGEFARTNCIEDRVFEDCVKKSTKFYRVKLPELLNGTFDWSVNTNRRGIKEDE